MPQQNLVTLTLGIILTLLCYQFAPKNRYAASIAYALNLIDRQYVDEVDNRALFTGAMNGIAEQLDPYSGYTGPVETKEFQEQLDQKFGGIGVWVELNQKTNRITILSPLIDTPAYKAGLMPGDTILAIDGKDTAELALRDCVELIHGLEGEPVTLKIERSGHDEPLEFTIVRAIIEVDSVMGDLRQSDSKHPWRFRLPDHPKIAYLRVTQFGDKTGQEFEQALRDEAASGDLGGVIIDLRHNAGGLLSAARDMCDALLEEKQEIVSTRGRDGKVMTRYFAEAGTVIPNDVPIVVLIDGFSASASEIVSACLQDHRRAKIVGERSWGKGTVQNMIPLPGNRGTLRLTIASFWRPSGVNIHKKRDAADADADWGVKPDPGCEVKMTIADLEKMATARRQRDAFLVKPGEDLPPEPPSAGDEGQEPEPPPMNLGRESPTQFDAQLKKAVDVIEGA